MGAWSCGVDNLKILREPAVVGLVGVSRATLWAWIKSQHFPQPVRLGPNCVGWRAGEIEAWLASRVPDATPKPTGKLANGGGADA